VDIFCLDGSEYIAECDERRAFISGFDGSAGKCSGFWILGDFQYRTVFL